ncbi:MAG: four helix bundle protein [Candidatus Vogelbacteria bacterium]|nr:four helix bundle protein [Candidatus Vogelbacteria bacterium]
MQKLKEVYLIWFQYYQILPKTHRYTLGQRVDGTLIETIEATATAAFLSKIEKLPFVRLAIRKIDTVKILLMVLWETESLEDKKYINLSEKLGEIGRMLGGWHGQILKQNSPTTRVGEK